MANSRFPKLIGHFLKNDCPSWNAKTVFPQWQGGEMARFLTKAAIGSQVFTASDSPSVKWNFCGFSRFCPFQRTFLNFFLIFLDFVLDSFLLKGQK